MKGVMRFKATLLSSLLLGLILASPAVAKQSVDRIAAVVGKNIILDSDIHRARAAGVVRLSTKKRKMTNHEILEELIKEQLLRQEVERLDIQVTPEEMQQGLGGILAQNRITLPQLKKELASKGIPFGQYRKDLEKKIQVMKFIQQIIGQRVNITEEDFEVYKRRFPYKAKRQNKEKTRQEILENKSREDLDAYLAEVRKRTYVEIK